MSQSIKTAAATAALLVGLLAHTEVADAQWGELRRWFRRLPRGGFGGFRGGGFGGGLALGAAAGAAAGAAQVGAGGLGGGWGRPGVGGWRGGWGGGWRGAGWGWRRPWAGYYRPWRRAWPWYGAGLIGAGWGWPYYSNIGYNSCYQLRTVWTNWGWRRQWVNVCWDGYSGGWSGWLGRLGLVSPRLISVREALSPRPHRGRLDRLISALVLSQRRFGSPAQMRTRAEDWTCLN